MRPIRVTSRTLKMPEDIDLSEYIVEDDPYNNLAAFEKYTRTKKLASDRFKEFSLTFDEFLKISSMDCHYCGIRPHQVWLKFPDGRFDVWWRLPPRPRFAFGKVHAYVCNGIDRIDNDQGYHSYNCVPSCYYCNTMKGAYTEEFFLERIKSIADHRFYNSKNQ